MQTDFRPSGLLLFNFGPENFREHLPIEMLKESRPIFMLIHIECESSVLYVWESVSVLWTPVSPGRVNLLHLFTVIKMILQLSAHLGPNRHIAH